MVESQKQPADLEDAVSTPVSRVPFGVIILKVMPYHAYHIIHI